MQNYKNHTRIHPFWHFVVTLMILALLIGSIRNYVHSDVSNEYSAALLVGFSILSLPFYWFIRRFALIAQDRAIRAEEKLRHYVLTGKPMDARLRTGQIIALRFASDEEFPELARKAAEESMKPAEIKKSIKNWKGDYYRI